jgi:hypothetical protein
MRSKESELSSVLIDIVDDLVKKRIAEYFKDPERCTPSADSPLQSLEKSKTEYPAQFKKFILQFPANRRKEQPQAYIAWKKLSEKNKLDVIHAAKNYCDDNLLRNNGQYIKYPERFIKHRTFEDWLERDEELDWITKAVEHYDSEYEKKTGMVNTWSDKLRTMAIEEFQRIGREAAADKIWVFFSDKDTKIRDECRVKGYGFFTFKMLVDNLLKDTAVKRPVRCPKCGEYGSHSPECPITLERIAAKEQEEREVAEGRLVQVSMGDLFKQKREDKLKELEG